MYRDKGVSWWVDSDLRGMTENSNLLHFYVSRRLLVWCEVNNTQRAQHQQQNQWEEDRHHPDDSQWIAES